MREIKLKVNSNGTLEAKQSGRLFLGTQDEKGSVRLVFDIDSAVEGIYYYVKFYHPKCTLLQRLTNKQLVIAENLFIHKGVWLLSFISSNYVLTYTEALGSYVFMTVPLEAYVNEGILRYDITNDYERRILELENALYQLQVHETSLVGMTFKELKLAEHITLIGSYFMYNTHAVISDLIIGRNVTRIGSYTFYDLVVERLLFESDSVLATIDDYAFSHLNFKTSNAEIIFPRTVSSYGRYTLQTSKLKSIKFESGSKIRNFLANSFYEANADEIYLPDGLTSFQAQNNGYIIRKSTVKKVWLPNTITSAIPAPSIYQCDYLTEIVLQDGFQASANFSNCTLLTVDSLVAMFEALKDLTSQVSKSLTIGEENLNKLTKQQKQIALNKNWTLS